jgi:peptidoglycan/LPS O-acetylase OafA/YrhL
MAFYLSAAWLSIIGLIIFGDMVVSSEYLKRMVYSGKISYSVYLLHLPIITGLVALTPLAQWPVVFLVVAFALTVAASHLSFLLIESPARRNVNRLASAFYPGDGNQRTSRKQERGR